MCVCVCVCVCVCDCVYVYMCMCLCACICACIYVKMHVYVYMCVCTFTCMYCIGVGMRDGVVLEMGALDGNTSSQSLVLERLGWKRILIEGNPTFREALQKIATTVTVAVSAAVCEQREVQTTRLHVSNASGIRYPKVHFVSDTKDNFTSGVSECVEDNGVYV